MAWWTGDEEWFTEEYRDSLVRLGRERQVGEDAVQMAYLELLEEPERPEDVSVFLDTRIRRRRRSPDYSTPPEGMSEWLHGSGDLSEPPHILTDVIVDWPLKARKVYYCMRVHEMSFRATALHLNISVGSVQYYLAWADREIEDLSGSWF